ncbi:unnamed protein product [Staurois parvus]|uniref:Uncharacterized protein n=1 Tax=Staurois parvus TaxID=386267 RepID=A0ABN9C199_9NEOB|nr:unnamed protein product [Staurois parvus]
MYLTCCSFQCTVWRAHSEVISVQERRPYNCWEGRSSALKSIDFQAKTNKYTDDGQEMCPAGCRNVLDADTVQEMTRDCGHSTGDDQRLRTQYRR